MAIHHIEPLHGNQARERVIGEADDGRIIVATRALGDDAAEGETIFDLADAERLAIRCISGDPRALTTPGLARIFSASIIVLTRAALKAGALQPQPSISDADATGNPDD